jgi:hypothetical protein
MFILRAKVKSRDASGEWRRFGLSGPDVASLVAERLGVPLPEAILGVAHAETAFAIRLGDSRFDLFVRPRRSAPALWDNTLRPSPPGRRHGLGGFAGATPAFPPFSLPHRTSSCRRWPTWKPCYAVELQEGLLPRPGDRRPHPISGQAEAPHVFGASSRQRRARRQTCSVPDLPGPGCGTVVNVGPGAASGGLRPASSGMQTSSYRGPAMCAIGAARRPPAHLQGRCPTLCPPPCPP